MPLTWEPRVRYPVVPVFFFEINFSTKNWGSKNYVPIVIQENIIEIKLVGKQQEHKLKFRVHATGSIPLMTSSGENINFREKRFSMVDLSFRKLSF